MLRQKEIEPKGKPMKKSMKKLTILHVSDFHFEACAKDEIKNIVSKLLDDIKKVQTEKDIFIDLVCFTGDLIRCGEQAQCGENQWELAMNMVIRPILNGLRLPDDRFVIAPGNHEIDKTKIVLGLEKGLQVRTIEEISENVRNFHESYKARLAYFYDIIKKSLPMACVKDLGYSYRIQLNGLKVGIACVDSAWRSSGKGAVEKGQLYIGREQIDCTKI